MILDYNPSRATFVIRVPRKDYASIREITQGEGWDFSDSASTPTEAILFTREEYAAAAFYQYATPVAAERLRRLNVEIEKSWKRESGAHIACPADQELAPFQKAGVEYALERKHTLIGDQPGLGKTMQAICVANEQRARRVLVVCPANVRLQWVKQIRRWTTMSWPYTVYPILHGRHGVNPAAQWTVISYDLARTPQLGAALARGSYDLLILDEGHYLKTVDTNRTRAVFGDLETGNFRAPVRNDENEIVDYRVLFPAIASRCGSVLALTGTPLPNRPREAYTLARNLCWDSIDWMSEEKFSWRFNPSERKEIVDPQTGRVKFYIDERSGRHGELQARLRVNFMVRREKRGDRGVMNQLKLPVYDIVQMEETGPIKQALKAESMLDIDPENFEGADAEVMGHIAVVRHMMGLALAPSAADYVAMLLDGGEDKVLLFGWHIDVLDILQERLNKFGVLRIDGRVSTNNKQKMVDQFSADPTIRVLVGNAQAMGTGTDGLQHAASHAVFAEADWVPGVNQQCVDRLDRMGQEREVLVDFLVAPNSFAERILASALRKNATTHKALDRVI